MAGVPRREVHCEDAVPWLRARGALTGCSIVTSLPDVSELGVDVPTWRAWFEDAARAVVDAVPDDGLAVFFQTDLRKRGVTVDKGVLSARAAFARGMQLLFSKIVCRAPPGTLAFGRPAFTRFLAFSVTARVPATLPIPDVMVDEGPRVWTRAIGTNAVAHAVRAVRAATTHGTIVDPFCGKGTFLAVANALGMDAIGVERNKRRAQEARELHVELGGERPG
jgi:hypothetical protein